MSCIQDVDASNQVAVWVKRGDTLRLIVGLRDAAGSPVDITGWSWRSQLRPTAEDPATVAVQVTVTDPTSGRLQLDLAPEVTAALEPRDYVFDVEATDGGGDVKTLVDGQLRIREDVTR